MILLIDNYDSFVYNLARYLEELGCATHVVRNDAVSVDEIRAMDPEAIVLSPGPCTPRDAGVCIELVQQLDVTVPLLGVPTLTSMSDFSNWNRALAETKPKMLRFSSPPTLCTSSVSRMVSPPTSTGSASKSPVGSRSTDVVH